MNTDARAEYSSSAQAGVIMSDEKRTARAVTPIRAIRKKCLDCSGDSAAEVRACELTACPLYPYRLGKNPNRKGRELSDTERAACADRLAKARAARAATA